MLNIFTNNKLKKTTNSEMKIVMYATLYLVRINICFCIREYSRNLFDGQSCLKVQAQGTKKTRDK